MKVTFVRGLESHNKGKGYAHEIGYLRLYYTPSNPFPEHFRSKCVTYNYYNQHTIFFGINEHIACYGLPTAPAGSKSYHFISLTIECSTSQSVLSYESLESFYPI